MNTGKEQTRNKTKYLAIPMAIFLLSAYSVLPGHMAAAQPSFVTYDQCNLLDNLFGSTVSTNPDGNDIHVSMNTVLTSKTVSSVTTEVVKTIHIEKEQYDCQTVQSQTEVTVDVTTYLEIFETLPGGHVYKAQALTTTCVKTPGSASGSSDNSVSVLGCTRGTEQFNFGNGQFLAPAEPAKDTTVIGAVSDCAAIDIDTDGQSTQVVNTVVSAANPGIVKTVDAQKEAFHCDDSGSSTIASGGSVSGDKKIDVVIFQDTVENVNTGETTQSWLSATCVTLVQLASVEDCAFSTQTSL